MWLLRRRKNLEQKDNVCGAVVHFVAALYQSISDMFENKGWIIAVLARLTYLFIPGIILKTLDFPKQSQPIMDQIGTNRPLKYTIVFFIVVFIADVGRFVRRYRKRDTWNLTVDERFGLAGVITTQLSQIFGPEEVIAKAKSNVFLKRMISQYGPVHVKFILSVNLICQAIYVLIERINGTQNQQVTIFNREKEMKFGEYIHLVGYANRKDTDPGSSGTKYYINKRDDKKSEFFHQKIFERNHWDQIVALPTQQDVQDNFKFHPRSVAREKNIQQYVAVPMCCSNVGIKSLIQVDSDVEGQFGSSEREVIDFAEIFIVPFRNMLYDIYCHYYENL